MTDIYPDFSTAFEDFKDQMRAAPAVRTERWQGVEANQETHELFDVCYQMNLQGIEDLDHWRSDIAPNLPWADDHFLERVGGEPLNPGEQWKHWPWSQSANKFRAANERFNHSYPERLWPKFARRTVDGKLFDGPKGALRKYPAVDSRAKQGIGHLYGDLQDFVELLASEPQTRQAYIPLFHPEDTGKGDGGRKMCSLGYHAMVRDDKLLWVYTLRSCDLRRHYSDDAYLSVRMMLWVLDRCREISPTKWADVKPGLHVMRMDSLHCFKNDLADLEAEKW